MTEYKMNLNELEQYLDKILMLNDFPFDPSKNGLQVQNYDKNMTIHKVAYAVDACLQTVERAIQENADVLLVHHGIFWSDVLKVTGTHYAILKKLLDGNLALYAAHIPLDANDEVGNNYGLARRLGLENLTGFGQWRQMTIGVKGEFALPLSLDEIVKKILLPNQNVLKVLPFGKAAIKTVGIISGGASEDVEDAINEGLDLYITGEVSHQIYHKCLENKINFVAAGHYNTEIVGVSLLAKRIERDTGLETVFIDVPTGL